VFAGRSYQKNKGKKSEPEGQRLAASDVLATMPVLVAQSVG
jgi:hypothetical protein